MGRRITPWWIDRFPVINLTQKTVDEYFKSVGARFDRSRRERASRSRPVGDLRSSSPNALQWV
jgi:hypothetical protein